MPVFEVRTDKSSASNPEFCNRYYVLAVDIDEAMEHGQNIVTAEKAIFSANVEFVNIYVRQMATTNRQNFPMSDAGGITGSPSISSVICAELVWGAQGSNPHYKRYRVQLTSSNITGLNWVSGYQTTLGGLVTFFDTMQSVLCTRTGSLLGPPAYNQEYQFRQLSPKWYNRNVAP